MTIRSSQLNAGKKS